MLDHIQRYAIAFCSDLPASPGRDLERIVFFYFRLLDFGSLLYIAA
jgi:hypothetical protein